MIDIYSWVLSPEIRDYLRTARPLTTEEKAEIIDSGYRPIVQKYAALTSLLRRTENENDKALLTDILRIYDWVFEELHSRRPGQVFIFQAAIMSSGPYDVKGVFRTYEELTEHLKEVEMSCQNCSLEYPYGVSFEGLVDKWAEIDGRMQCVLSLGIYLVDRKIIIPDFGPWYLDDVLKNRYKERKIGSKAVRFRRTGNTTIPLPFHTGDLVQVLTPEMVWPRYGVVIVKETSGRDRRCVRMAYIENYRIEHMDLSYQNFDYSSNWRVIDWTRPIQPADLPEEDGILAEWSEALHKLDEKDTAAIEKLFYGVAGDPLDPSRMAFHTPVPFTLGELLDNREMKN